MVLQAIISAAAFGGNKVRGCAAQSYPAGKIVIILIT